MTGNSAPPPLGTAAWLVDVHGQPVRSELTFRNGQTFEQGMPVGTYEHVGTTFIATIGEDARLIVDLQLGQNGGLAARLLTKRGGATLDEQAALYSVVCN